MPSKPTGEERRPPSFEPPTRQSRPAGDDARTVGGPTAPRRPMTRPATPARPAAAPVPAAPGGPPPSIAPDAAARGAGAPPRRSSAPARPVPGRRPADDAGDGRGAASPAGPAATGTAPAPRRTTSRPGRTSQHPGTARPPGGGAPARPAPRPDASGARRRRRRRVVVSALVLVLVLVLAWPIGLAVWANGRLRHVDALSGAADTPGTTYLLAGSDERAPGEEDGTAGARADTIMLLQVPESGPAALISIPRDTFVEIPGFSASKINAAYSWGGPALLVATVEQLSGLTVDHFVEVGFGGVEGVVDALDGVELCSDLDVTDPMTGLVWTPGCHMTGGHDALMFARMRYVDPEGDIGRAKRQREVISGITSSAASPSTLVNPGRQVSLIRAGTDAMTLDQGTDVVDLGRLALAFRAATGQGGITGTPPIRSLDYRPGDGIGSTVQLDPDQTPTFFQQVRDGTLPPGVVGGVPS